MFCMDADQRDNVKNLWLACKDGKEKQVAELLDAQVDPNTPLHLGAPLEISGDHNSTFLHWAARFGHTGIMKLLLERGAGLDAQDGYGRTPLVCALQAGQRVAVDLLIERGANLDTVDLPDGNAALTVPVLGFCPQLVKCLIKAGVDVSATNSQGNNVLNSLCENIMLRTWQQQVPGQDKDEMPALAIIAMLRKRGIARDVQDQDGYTPFHFVALINNARFLSSLVIPPTSEALKRQARERFFAFLCANNRSLGLSHEILYRIFSHVAVDCHYSGLTKLFVAKEERKAFKLRFLDDCVSFLPTLVSPEESSHLVTILKIRNGDHNKAMDLANDPEIRDLLDPQTWELNTLTKE